ncbi:MAG: glycosyl hydrolase, partial [Candidatus Aminicenantales bacterium]
VPAYHTYLARCQHMLRQGLPVADVCYLVAEGAPQVFRAPASALRGSPPDRLGWNFDACAPETLMADMSVKNGRLVLPDGMSYAVLVLPERETMTPALLRKIRDLTASGATIIGPPPRKSPGLAGFPRCDAVVKALTRELWGDCDGTRITEHALGKGRVIWELALPATTMGKANISEQKSPGLEAAPDASRQAGAPGGAEQGPAPIQAGAGTWDVGAAPLSEPEQYGDFAIVARTLTGIRVTPDFESKAGLRYTHRRDGQTDVYFVANSGDLAMAADCLFRVAGKHPEVWDAVTGEIRALPEFAESAGRTAIPLKFEAHQSFFIVFRNPAAGPKSVIKAVRQDVNFVPAVESGKLLGPWDVAFDPKWGGPEKITFDELDDWSRRAEEGIKYYSGPATYRKTFDMPGAHDGGGSARRTWLDLGAVKNIARVRLNGKDLGVVWCAPWRVEITGMARPKGNQLEITVANLWPNRLIGDEQLPPDCDYGPGGNLARWPEWLMKGNPRPSAGRYTFTTWKHFDKNSPLLPSGLLGPVTIRSEWTIGLSDGRGLMRR